MSNLHFNKQGFVDSLKTNKNLVTYLSTTIGLMLTLLMHSLIQGDIKLEYFAYAVVVSFAFYVWAVVDNRYRKEPCKISD
ncbi:hypothetical protein [Acinetobacter larvae]|uniref:Uncharacterized protein n=1 Tax=Acinetobacter larvae TaxID=1789224 RepID=A0A1B2LYI9_9GAMM|nr:hypothetical protein [Acinetobacter larvae]AOA57995.1 hypothetical protein BFG52_06280 [Acinetobacter larvae]